MTDVAAKARRSQALVYWLRLPYRGRFESGGSLPAGILPTGERTSSAWRSAEEHRREFDLLRQTVEESGGRIVPLASIDRIEAAFQDILAELRDQYVIGYYPDRSRHDGSWRQIRVRLRPEGYVDLRRYSAGRCSGRIGPPPASRQACSRIRRSSRRLPGRGWRARTAKVRRSIFGRGSRPIRASRERARSGRSPRRSRSGGSSMGKAPMRK